MIDTTSLSVGDIFDGIIGEWVVTCAKSYHICLRSLEDKHLTISLSPLSFPTIRWEGHIAWPYTFGGSFDRQPSACVYPTLNDALISFYGEPDGRDK